jgi:SAM-dependent methyltransferase
MSESVLAQYHRALVRGTLHAYLDDGAVVGVDIRRWLADVDEDDATVLDRCSAPVLDLGCGPGRFVRALNRAGVPALGVDIAEVAVSMARAGGSLAVVRDVFERLPAEGRWPTVLVIDGNIGIGADPRRLLRRARELTAPGGRILVEVSPRADLDVTVQVRLSPAGRRFPWALVGSCAVRRYGAAAGLVADDAWRAGARSFVGFTRPRAAASITARPHAIGQTSQPARVT